MGAQKLITARTLAYCCLDGVGAPGGLRVDGWYAVIKWLSLLC